ncbi:MAG: transcription termination/antitermination protein NusG [Terriglobales bacterium]
MIDSLPMPSWYAVQTRSRHEKLVAQELGNRGLESYLPLVSEIHRWSDRRKAVDVPLFAGYTFVRMLATADAAFKVKRTNGVVAIVGTGAFGTPIEDAQIESIRILLAAKHPVVNYPFLKLGQRVRIRGGALEGVEGILAATRGENKLVISIELIQRSLAVTINNYDIEPA